LSYKNNIGPTHEIDLNELIEYVIKTYEKIVSKENIKLNFQKN
jgi:hypothetical protein